MRAILIDADPHALYVLEKQLTSLSHIEVVGTYQDSYLGKEAVLAEEIDVLFLETLLPRLSGVVLAKRLMEKRPNLLVVFVTAHEEYALDAYNINALDYMLKPVQNERLEKAIERLELKFSKNCL